MTGERGRMLTYLLVGLIPLMFLVGFISADIISPEGGTGDDLNITLSMVIDFDDGTNITLANISSNSSTVFDFLAYCAAPSIGNYTYSFSYWPSFDSILVEEIAGYESGTGGKYWEYKVNDELPMVGADKYYLEDGDMVEWNFLVPVW